MNNIKIFYSYIDNQYYKDILPFSWLLILYKNSICELSILQRNITYILTINIIKKYYVYIDY